jgi:hypothetical protein
VSLSPETEATNSDYKNGWRAINKLLSQGKSWSGHEANCMFVNMDDGKFADSSVISGLNFKDDGRSAVAHDIDLDGNLDLLVTNRTAPRLRVMRNQAESNHNFIQLKLVGATNPDAIGARVEVHLNDGQRTLLTQTRRAGSGYQAQSSAWLHFGLGDNDVSQIIVKWPNSEVSNFKNVTNGKRYLISQSENSIALQLPSKAASITDEAGDKIESVVTPFARILLPNPIPMPQLRISAPYNDKATLFGAGTTAATATVNSKALFINLWSESCAPCITELSAINNNRDRFLKANVVPVALNVTSNQAPNNWSAPHAQATTQCIDILDTIQRTLTKRDITMPTPSSFLVDARGNLVVFYLGAVDIDVITSDFELLNMTDAQRLEAAVPFSGRWLTKAPSPSLLALERAFTENEMHETAREFQVGYIYVQMARGYTETQKLDLALKYFDLAAEEGPYFFEAYSGRGYVKQLGGDIGGAIADYTTALALRPSDKTVMANLEKARAALKD